MSNDDYESFEHNGFTVEICIDRDARDPRQEVDHFTTLACWHREYNLGDRKIERQSASELKEDVGEKILAILPLYLYQHSGITMRCGPFSDPWDSGQVGWAYITEKQADALGKSTDESQQDYFERVIREEVAEYDCYLTGEVYGYVVKDADGDVLDSCWGFYGDLDYVRQAAREAAEHCEPLGKVHGACNATCES